MNIKEYRQELADDLINWIDDAKCKGDSEQAKAFYSASLYDQREAAIYCFDCPVQLRCAEYACITETTGSLRAGVWGGMTEAERNTLMKQLREREQKEVGKLAEDGGAWFRRHLIGVLNKIESGSSKRHYDRRRTKQPEEKAS